MAKPPGPRTAGRARWRVQTISAGNFWRKAEFTSAAQVQSIRGSPRRAKPCGGVILHSLAPQLRLRKIPDFQRLFIILLNIEVCKLIFWRAGGGTLQVGGAEATLGAQRPGGPADSGGGARLSLEESRRKEHQGGRGSSSLDPPFLVGGTLRGFSLFFCLACGPVSYARNGPPTGWAGWEGAGILGPAALGSQNWGMHPEPRQRSWHSRGEQSFLPGACPCKKQIGFCSGPCEGRKSATLGSSLPKAFPSGVEQSGGLFGQVQAKPP